MSATESLSNFVAGTTYEQLSPDVVAAAKRAILDGIAVTVAGSVQELSKIAVGYVRELGGAEQSSVVGWGFKTNALSAAFANGILGHCLDYEIQGFPPTHGTSSCLPSALALGEHTGASGKTIIVAYVLGWEVQGRLRAASAHAMNPAYHPPGVVGPFGGAAASAKVLGLNAEQVNMAFGVAASRTGGLTANTGTMVKSTHPGNAARMGVEAALLARAGYTATLNILETPRGFADALFDGDMHWDTVTDGLGDGFRLVEPGYHIKRFPAQIHMQNPTEAVLNLRAKHDLSAEQVLSLEVRTGSRGHSGSLPRSGLDGKFSLEYCTAAALLDGRVNMQTFTDARRFAVDMEQTLTKIKVIHDDAIPDVTTATASLQDGRTISETCEGYSGAADRPMSRDQHMEKITDCLRLVYDDATAGALVAQLENLEQVDDISSVMAILRCNP